MCFADTARVSHGFTLLQPYPKQGLSRDGKTLRLLGDFENALHERSLHFYHIAAFLSMWHSLFSFAQRLSVYLLRDARPYNERHGHHRTDISPVVEGECRGFKDDVNYGHIDNGYPECRKRNYGSPSLRRTV